MAGHDTGMWIGYALAADSVVIPGCGHYCIEEAPQEILEALTAFLAPYQDGPAATSDPGPHAAMD